MTAQIPSSAREVARLAAQAKLAGLMPGQTGINLANEVADAVLEAAYAQIATRLARLERDSAELHALEAAGVDNWDGYSDALNSLD